MISVTSRTLPEISHFALRLSIVTTPAEVGLCFRVKFGKGINKEGLLVTL